MEKKKLVVLTVLDGWGIAPPGDGNAIASAKKTNYNRFLKDFPTSQLSASGRDVGLKEDEPGNSEAGHENMGAGRTIEQDKILISESIRDGTFFKNAAFVEALNHAKKNRSSVHLIGLLSDERSGHVEPEHAEALLLFFKRNNFERVYLHILTDGRDTPPKSAEQFLKRMILAMNSIGIGTVVTVAGRYYAMDRAHNYSRVWRAYEAMVYGRGRVAENAYQAIQKAYNRGETDEFIAPTVIPQPRKTGGSAPVTIKEGDSVIFYNLRSDRARQLTRVFLQPDFIDGEAGEVWEFKKFEDLFFVTMTEFSSDFPALIAYPTRLVFNCLPAYLEKFNDVHQLYISESEKFAHVTYFFHGNTNRVFRNEKRVRIDSRPVATFDLEPKMSAPEITDQLVDNLRTGLYNFCLVNFPNADMLGHTGDIKAAKLGIQEIDKQLGRLWEAVRAQRGAMIITGDHGNAEEMIDPHTKEQLQEHSRNPVPFILLDENLRGQSVNLRTGTLRDIAPTVLDLMGLSKPKEMLGVSLLRH
ncbi:MAG: phosphoglycerate mutase (2,3-diphosphoglycerate-independent) [Candidatus Doudnabacteria bacterium RIFCSPHIGHO2_01_FULL_50_11]|uniref:2,3-bisphosphoglycerate-independent phosphoglycerate mutase n=1 Tax=Candidatus Doudnabacteria bacterium RIFCSPHIGHO2_01_FULL_50_11 TaxID=1817828 RepID=A0A1F5PMP5_9BACT|nr:MAG: phosphoglycerate mutase (2,3-diphosphoglycerate-independent) [Candidatus Doudnabacteria bacterium RIFCSPHIGHO2_01_FULL_50_11]HLC44639.1 2,3-bisphosphoglycerate-independent phosphoglycerate mutase [Patescibacteria group bacterium]